MFLLPISLTEERTASAVCVLAHGGELNVIITFVELWPKVSHNSPSIPGCQYSMFSVNGISKI